MRRFFLYLFLLISMLQASISHALTAVCKDPIGRAYGNHGILGQGKVLDEPDDMKGGLFTIIWNEGQNQAQMISQGSGGGSPMTETGFLVFASKEQISFLVTYPSAVWLYSLYSKPKMLLMTTHNNGMSIDTGGAVVKSLKASCEISGN